MAPPHATIAADRAVVDAGTSCHSNVTRPLIVYSSTWRNESATIALCEAMTPSATRGESIARTLVLRLYPVSEVTSQDRARVDFDDPTQREVALRVGRAWREVRRGASMSRLIEHFFGIGRNALEIGQMDTLDLLVQQPQWRMGDLADALRVDPSTATRAVQRLEKFGLAQRCTGTDDKRVVMVSASESGRARHAEAAARREEVLQHIMSEYDPNEFEQLAVLMERFVRSLDEFVGGLDNGRSPAT